MSYVDARNRSSLRKLAATLLLSGMSVLASMPSLAATPSLEDIARQLHISATLEGDFVQRK